MKFLKNTLAVFILSLLAGAYVIYTNSQSELILSTDLLIKFLKISGIFFLLLFMIYFGYNFIIRASRKNSPEE